MGTSRNASLDGLRAVAVLLVLLYHHGMLNSGWLGVDLFFCLSGFLITTILRRERHSNSYWRSFWTKRVLRIVPPLLLVMLLTGLLGFPLSPLHALAYLLSLGDVLAYLRPHFEALRALWSLAVEEHFYLLWPFAIRRLQRGTLLVLLIGLVAVEPLLRGIISLHNHQWELTYFLTPFRLDGLALGALMSVVLEEATANALIRRWCLPAGAAFVAVWIALRFALGDAFTRDNPTVTYNALCYSLVAGASVCSVAYLITSPTTLTTRILSIRPLAFIGTLSYGIYLYSVPIHEAMMRSWPALGRASVLLDLPLTLCLATVSYYGIERPLMRLGHSLISPKPQQRVDPAVWPGHWSAPPPER